MDFPMTESLETAPPELLDRIFSFVHDVDDIKTIRLVNRHWRNAAKRQINKRLRLKLRERTNGNSKMNVVQVLNSLGQVDEFAHIQILETLPVTLENLLPTTLVSLHLKNVVFFNKHDLRRLIFQTFGSMQEVVFDRVLLSKQAKETPLTPLIQELVPKVKKLAIIGERPFDRRTAVDLFDVWNLKELIDTFAGSLKDIRLQRISREKSRWNEEYDLFTKLQSANIFATAIGYQSVETVKEATSLRSYLESHGRNLKWLHVDVGGFDVLSMLFDRSGQAICPLEYLKLDNQDWRSLETKKLLQLKGLNLQKAMTLPLRFLGNMANLEYIENLSDTNLSIDPEIPYVAENVHTISLNYISTPYVNQLSILLPNLRTITVELYSYADLSPLQKFAPSLTYLRVGGYGLANFNISDMQWLTTLTSLRSFIHDDVHCRGQPYGDEFADEIFFGMPTLRSLQISTCSMSPQIISQLRDKLLVFTFRKKIQNL